MKRSTFVAPVLASLVFAVSAAADEPTGTGGTGLPAEEFHKLHDELRPPQDAWEGLPWRLSLLEACAAAAEEKKPVYMLVRSGHPLGCV